MTKEHDKIRDTLMKFCDLMLENEPNSQSVKVVIGMKDKKNVKFKKYREGTKPKPDFKKKK